VASKSNLEGADGLVGRKPLRPEHADELAADREQVTSTDAALGPKEVEHSPAGLGAQSSPPSGMKASS
jgi:hypothetical protein